MERNIALDIYMGAMDERTLARFAEYKTSLERLTERAREGANEPEKLECRSCESFYSGRLANLTKGYCPACFEEKEFGIIRDSVRRSIGFGCGSSFYFRSDDEDPVLHNGIRALENALE